MARVSTGRDFQAELFKQRDAAVALFGQDPEASSIAGTVRPFTPPEFARILSADWGDTYWPLVHREIESESSFFDGIGDALFGVGGTIIQRAEAEFRTLREDELSIVNVEMRLPLTTDMTRSLISAFIAANGPTRNNSAGVKCLVAGSCATFWDSMSTYGINAGAVRASVTSGERWKVFADAIPQGFQDVADAIGRATAAALRTAGEALGAGAHGFFDQLGVVDSIILLGGGILLFRTVL